MDESIEFVFVLAKVQNMKDGGYRVTLDLASVFAAQAAMLLVHADRPGVIGHAVIGFEGPEVEGKTL